MREWPEADQPALTVALGTGRHADLAQALLLAERALHAGAPVVMRVDAEAAALDRPHGDAIRSPGQACLSRQRRVGDEASASLAQVHARAP